MQLAYHCAVASCGHGTMQKNHANTRQELRKRVNFNHDIVFGNTMTCLGISETNDLRRILHKASLEFIQNCVKNKQTNKHCVWSICKLKSAS